jgi:hypothetical protein
VPRLVVTDKLRSYGTAFQDLRLTCRHKQGLRYLQPSTPSHLPVDAADIQSRSGSAMVRRRRGGIRPDQPLPPFNPTLVAATKPPGLHPPWTGVRLAPLKRQRPHGGEPPTGLASK